MHPSRTDHIRTRIEGWLEDRFGDLSRVDGDVALPLGTTVTYVNVDEWGDNRTIVRLMTPLAARLATTPELLAHVARHADDLMLGHVAMQDYGDNGTTVYLAHRFYGEYVDPEELLLAVEVLAINAVSMREELQARFRAA